jgi:hypothetical protein
LDSGASEILKPSSNNSPAKLPTNTAQELSGEEQFRSQKEQFNSQKEQ